MGDYCETCGLDKGVHSKCIGRADEYLAEIERLTTESSRLRSERDLEREDAVRLRAANGELWKQQCDTAKENERLSTENGDLKLTIEMLRSMDGRGQIERLTAEVNRLKVEATCNHCGEYHGREVCEKLRTDYFRMKEALAIIADWYKPNWIPGDTHATVQRLSKIAHKALASVSGSQPHPQREIAAEINEESEPWASQRAADSSQELCGCDIGDCEGSENCQIMAGKDPLDAADQSQQHKESK